MIYNDFLTGEINKTEKISVMTKEIYKIGEALELPEEILNQSRIISAYLYLLNVNKISNVKDIEMITMEYYFNTIKYHFFKRANLINETIFNNYNPEDYPIFFDIFEYLRAINCFNRNEYLTEREINTFLKEYRFFLLGKNNEIRNINIDDLEIINILFIKAIGKVNLKDYLEQFNS